LPGKSYFIDINEVLPGYILKNDGIATQYWKLNSSSESFEQQKFEQLLSESIQSHEISDVTNVALLSGGLDSAVISAISSIKTCYTVGLIQNNEFIAAQETADILDVKLHHIELTVDQLRGNWKYLTLLRGEPLSLPNEGLIYAACKAMQLDEKVVLTGEGADELLFGYENIYRWAMDDNWKGVDDFLSRYGYAMTELPTKRLVKYIDDLHSNKTTLEFVEDFFYLVHLPGLLRRMDFASMAASKEVRVPFVSKKLIEYMYRKPVELKLSSLQSKIPLRHYSEKIGLKGALQR
jgi:asparagine synthase (glutamine-hydrolysing)